MFFSKRLAEEYLLNAKHFDHAFYVGRFVHYQLVRSIGIPLSSDGHVHLFGNLSCAFAKREILETQGIRTMIVKVSISHCGQPKIDFAEEELSNKAPGDHNEVCHGFMFSKPIYPDAIIEFIDFL